MDKVTREQENEVSFPLHVLQKVFVCGQSRGTLDPLVCFMQQVSGKRSR